MSARLIVHNQPPFTRLSNKFISECLLKAYDECPHVDDAGVEPLQLAIIKNDGLSFKVTCEYNRPAIAETARKFRKGYKLKTFKRKFSLPRREEIEVLMARYVHEEQDDLFDGFAAIANPEDYPEASV